MLTSLTGVHCLTNLSALGAILCVPNGGPLIKLPNVTFTINEPPMRHLLWCNKVPRGKRTKCAKINGVTHQETTNK